MYKFQELSLFNIKLKIYTRYLNLYSQKTKQSIGIK